MNKPTATIETLRKRLLSLATARVVEGKTDEKTATAYSTTVAELAKRTKTPAKQIRTMIRRQARSHAA